MPQGPYDDEPTAQDKLDAIVSAVKDQDADEDMSDWEIGFIANQEEKHKKVDVAFSTNEDKKLEEIYEKLWTKGYFDK